MLDWEVVWSEATTPEGEPRERVIIRTLDGRDVIQYVVDGQRWRLNWRGWIVYGETGNEDQPVPEEISQSVPRLGAIPDVLEGSPEVANAPDRTTLSRDYSDEVDGVLERRLEVDVADGRLVSARVVETAGDREQVRPELTVLGISRSTGFDPGAYEVGMEPPFPENDVSAPRYQVPDDEWSELRVTSMRVDNNPVREQYRLSWNGLEFDLAVWPSRGGVDLARIPRSVDQSSITAVNQYSHGTLIWAHRQFAGYPTDALWDNGRYRFELALDRDSVLPEHDWDLNELIRLADALSSVDDMPELLRDRGRGRMSQYPTPSMFNY